MGEEQEQAKQKGVGQKEATAFEVKNPLLPLLFLLIK